MTLFSRVLALALLAAGTASSPQAKSNGGAVEVVCRVKVLSDKVADVSSLEAWRKSFIKDGMTDEEKALAAWRTVASFQHQDAPPVEHLQQEETVQDAIKMFNVYGYGFCSMASAHVACLSRYVGLQARGWGVNSHSVSEVRWDGAWHLLDASLINYFPKPDRKIASVEELIAATNEWYAKNPGYKHDNKKLADLMRQSGWTGWKQGPPLLGASPMMDAGGWWPARTHGWYSSMQEYDGTTGKEGTKAFLYEYGYSQGYQVDLRLRPGERLTRNWSNQGLHVNMKGGGAPGCMTMQTGKDSLVYTPKFGDIAPGRVGNGTLEYDVPAAKLKGPGPLEIRMPSSYVYLSGKLLFRSPGAVSVSFSDNHGLDWKEIAKGSGAQEMDLSPHVFRRYDYRLKFDGRLESLRIVHDVQHSQRALPALGQGRNTITFGAGPAEGTITVEGSTNPSAKGKQLHYTDFHPEIDGFEPNCFIGGSGKGSITFPVSTPGDLVRLRFGAHYRARDARDGLDYLVSFDGGKTWKTAGRAAGPVAGNCHYVTFADVPPGTREAKVRYAGTSRNATGIMNFRIDADYKEPQGGFRPVRVTYRWEEGGRPKEDVHVARKPDETWTIPCAATPLMKSIVLELAE